MQALRSSALPQLFTCAANSLGTIANDFLRRLQFAAACICRSSYAPSPGRRPTHPQNPAALFQSPLGQNADGAKGEGRAPIASNHLSRDHNHVHDVTCPAGDGRQTSCREELPTVGPRPTVGVCGDRIGAIPVTASSRATNNAWQRPLAPFRIAASIRRTRMRASVGATELPQKRSSLESALIDPLLFLLELNIAFLGD